MVYSKLDDDNGVLFDLIKSASGKTYQVAFDLRAYNSYTGGDHGCPSGAYIFKPDTNQQTSLRYAGLTSVASFNGKFTSEMQLEFTNAD